MRDLVFSDFTFIVHFFYYSNLYSMDAKLFLDTIVRSLVDNVDAISIEQKEDELGTLLLLKVDVADMGVIIGR